MWPYAHLPPSSTGMRDSGPAELGSGRKHRVTGSREGSLRNWRGRGLDRGSRGGAGRSEAGEECKALRLGTCGAATPPRL